MRKTSKNKALDELLAEHYDECYNVAMDIIKTKSKEEALSICKLKDDEAKAYADSFDYDKAEAANDIRAILGVGFKLNEACAYMDAGKALLSMGSIN